MVVRCEDVWREVSNYLDADVEPELQAAIEEHVRGCKHCTAVVEGTRNVIEIYGDDRMVEVPLGFSRRLHGRLEGNVAGGRRSFFGWMVAAAAAVLLAGGFEAARSLVFGRPGLRSELARRSHHVPPDMMVIVADDGKTFHVAGCPFIHHKHNLRTLPAREAEREGYAPCVRCMKKYLDVAVLARPDPVNEVADAKWRLESPRF